MNLLIMGPAGSGKGTMSAIIQKHLGIPHISTGDMFREAIAEQTPVGVEAKVYIDQGKLVPDDVTNRMVRERLRHEDCANGFLLDGYPRNIGQVMALDDALREMGKELDGVMYLHVDYDTLLDRITGRRVCHDCGAIYHLNHHPPKVKGVCDICGGQLYQREDDTKKEFSVRYNIYKEQTAPVVYHYAVQGLVYGFDGSQDTKIVSDQIVAVLEAIK